MNRKEDGMQEYKNKPERTSNHNGMTYYRRRYAGREAGWLWLALVVVLSGCGLLDGDEQTEFEPDEDEDEWLIPDHEVVDGGPGKDGIPSIDDPQFERAADVAYVDDDRLVVGMRVGDEVRAYPHQVVDHHEIVNDRMQGRDIALTHCPLTGTGIAWDRAIDGDETEFGVSGLIFRNNLIAYDRQTDSYWPQMQLRSAHGEYQGAGVETVPVVETTWRQWQAVYPESKVLTDETGFQRDYGSYLYGEEYLEDENQILFPVRHEDDRLDGKKRVHGVIGERPADESAPVTVYVIDGFDRNVELVEDAVGPHEYIIAGASEPGFAVAFRQELEDGTRPVFEPVQSELPVIMEDGEGNRWDWFGYAVEGPREGERLQATESYTGYFFAWADFFPGLDIYEPLAK